MKKINIITTLVVFVAVIVYFSSSAHSDGLSAGAPLITFAPGKATPLSPVMPFDVTLPKPPVKLDLRTNILKSFDLFSWHSFIAICWPTKSGEVIGQFGDNATVWESWKKNYEVFLDNGHKPEPWNITTQSKQVELSQTGKTPPSMEAIFQPFLTGPLIDQHGEYNRFEIAINQEMFDYIDKHTLYNIEGQRKFTGTVNFPMGNNDKKTFGAVMVKASWKILGKDDDASHFHTVKALVHIPKLESKGIQPSSHIALVGLVGLHIGTRTAISPQWIWSTFEQVDNAPDLGHVQAGKHYNFYNPAAGDHHMNEAPVQPWNPGIKGQVPSQVVRLTPVDRVTQSVNDSIHKLIVAINPHSVWQYYKLIGTQWPVDPKASNTGNPFPVFMANSTLETYDQGNVHDGKVTYAPGVTSSCIDCHNGATTWGGKPADFTFLLKTAKPFKK